MKIYQRPATDIVLLTIDESLLQGVDIKSGQQGPPVIDDPVNPDPGSELSNTFNLWEEEEIDN